MARQVNPCSELAALIADASRRWARAPGKVVVVVGAGTVVVVVPGGTVVVVVVAGSGDVVEVGPGVLVVDVVEEAELDVGLEGAAHEG